MFCSHTYRRYTCLLIAFLFSFYWIRAQQPNPFPPSSDPYFSKLAHPVTGEIPANIRSEEIRFSSHLPVEHAYGKSFGGGYTFRGPFNFGGRTRSIATDHNNGAIWIAGSATGGLWRSTDSGQSWNKCYDSSATLSVTWVHQDTRAGKSNLWYAGTGELAGGTLQQPVFYSGNGVLKSYDNGLTWNHLNSTNTSPGGINNSWSAVFRVRTNPRIDSLDVVFVAAYDGVFRSIDGGQSFIRRRGSGATTSQRSTWTDVAITQNGIVYAALSSGGTQAGIWRSADNGASWTNITPAYFTSKMGRIVIAPVPSDTHQIYFLVNYTDSAVKSGLWKYRYISGNGSASGGRWENRHLNGASGYDNLNGYCMHLEVHPGDSQYLLLSGTNLYTSPDAFTSDSNTKQIGGLGFPGYHKNSHQVYFIPGDTQSLISVHDAGISLSSLYPDSPITWELRNRGYNTVALHSIGMDHSSTSGSLVVGAREWGTSFIKGDSSQPEWKQLMKGEGGYTQLLPQSAECYAGGASGELYRILMDTLGNAIQYARLTPDMTDTLETLPLSPFVYDANKPTRLFTVAGRSIWRNSDISAIPLTSNPDSAQKTALNWTELLQAHLQDSTARYTALFSSKLQNGFLYAGTNRGKLYRIIQTDLDTVIAYDISGNNFPSAYIQCIVQHPKNANRLYVVFSNYGVRSIYTSTDGGSNWTDVSGNLEQNPDGSGSGPACLWFTVANIRNSDLYFVGTTTGLYATKSLVGSATVWTRQAPESIGMSIVTRMEHRSIDGMFAVSTFGSGAYTAYVQSVNEQVEESMSRNNSLFLYPIPVTNTLFIMPAPRVKFAFSIFDAQGRLMKQGNQQTGEIDVSGLNTGIYLIQIQQNQQIQAARFLKE